MSIFPETEPTSQNPSPSLPPRRVAIGLGSNWESAERLVREALLALEKLPAIEVIGVSRFRRTRPVGGPLQQPPYVNAVAVVKTDLAPGQIWQILQRVETQFGRTRTEHWGPRSLDLDILLDEAGPVCDGGLYIPHPRLAARRFFLEALAELHPQWWHFWSGLTVGRILSILRETPPWIILIPETFPPFDPRPPGTGDAPVPTGLGREDGGPLSSEDSSGGADRPLAHFVHNAHIAHLASDVPLSLPQRLGLAPIAPESVLAWWRELEEVLRRGRPVLTALPPQVFGWACFPAIPGDPRVVTGEGQNDSRADPGSGASPSESGAAQRRVLLRPRLVILGPAATHRAFWAPWCDEPSGLPSAPIELMARQELIEVHAKLLARIRQIAPVILVEDPNPDAWPEHVSAALAATEESGSILVTV